MVGVLFIAGVVALGTFNILKKKQLLNDDSTKEWINILLSFIKITLVMVAGIFAFNKYMEYKQQENYEKAVTFYAQNSLDLVNEEISKYKLKILVSINRLAEEASFTIIRISIKESKFT